MLHAQVLSIQNHYDDSSLKLERWIGKKILCLVHVVFASCLSRFLAFHSLTPQHTLPLTKAAKLFHFSRSVSLPNEEDTVPSGNLSAYFKCDGASEVAKVIVFL